MGVDRTSPAFIKMKTGRFRGRYETLKKEIHAFEAEIGARPRSIFRVVQNIDGREAGQAQWDLRRAAIRESIYPDV